MTKLTGKLTSKDEYIAACDINYACFPLCFPFCFGKYLGLIGTSKNETILSGTSLNE